MASNGYMMSKNDDMKRKDPFQAPEGYFDSLADRIEARIDQEAEKPAARGRIIRMPMAVGYAAAAVITLLAVFWLVTRDETTPTSDELIARLSDQEIIEYLASSDMPLEEIIEITDFGSMESDSLDLQVMPDLDLAPGEIDELIELYDLEELENS